MSTPTFPFLEKRAKIFSSTRVSLKIFEISKISKFEKKNVGSVGFEPTVTGLGLLVTPRPLDYPSDPQFFLLNCFLFPGN